jgi:hypothetical protein
MYTIHLYRVREKDPFYSSDFRYYASLDNVVCTWIDPGNWDRTDFSRELTEGLVTHIRDALANGDWRHRDDIAAMDGFEERTIDVD